MIPSVVSVVRNSSVKEFFGKGVYFLPKSIAVERIGHFGIDGCSAVFGAVRFQFFGYGEVVHGYLSF